MDRRLSSCFSLAVLRAVFGVQSKKIKKNAKSQYLDIPFAESVLHAYRLKASNAAPPFSTSTGTSAERVYRLARRRRAAMARFRSRRDVASVKPRR